MSNMNDFIVELVAKINSSQALNDVDKLQKELTKRNINLKSVLDTTASKQELQNFAAQIQTIFKEKGIDIDTGEILSSLNQIGRQAETVANKINKIQFKIDTQEYSTQVASITTQLSKFGSSNEGILSDAKNSVNELTHEYKNMVSVMADMTADDNAKIKSEENYQKALAKTKNLLKQLQSDKDNEIVSVGESKRVNLIRTLNNYLQKNTAITTDNKSKIQQWIDTLASSDDLTIGSIKNINNEFKKLDIEIRKSGKIGLSWSDKLKKTWDKIGGLSLAAGSMMAAWTKTKESISELKEVDTYLTEISKANDKLSKSDIKQIGNNSFDVASKYGKDAISYLSGIQEASRAGYENAEGIAELSVAAQGAGDMTDELANRYIVATDKAYKMKGSVDALTETLDGANNITNNNAVNMTELAEGMSVVGSQAASSQMKVNETTAAIGTLIATTQKSGSEMGNAFKGILMNLQQVTGEVEDGEDAIDESSLTKYEKACKELGVSLSTVKDGVVSLKEPMQILKELSKEYTKLDESDAKRANLLSAVGGKYRANALNAILENYDMYEKMLQDYTDGKGSMAEEAEKTANSWEGSMNRLSNTWTSVVSNIADSDAITTGINALNGLLGVVEKLTSGFTQLSSFLTSGFGLLGEGNSSFGTLGAISGLLMNKAGIGERTMFQW